jgi:hypothetical protein
MAGDGICWIQFDDETALRLVADPAVGTLDFDEKDYIWGDVDHDGDTDLVVARKQPFSSKGRRVNVLFINEGKAEGHAVDGVLVDRSALYAAESGDCADDGAVVLTDIAGFQTAFTWP